MFIKKSSPKQEEVSVNETIYRCTMCGKPFIPECCSGVCQIYCPKCQSQKNTPDTNSLNK
jgi:hypothetical protein